jgi:glycosyltransferase involved in cell wall biosynthesis
MTPRDTAGNSGPAKEHNASTAGQHAESKHAIASFTARSAAQRQAVPEALVPEPLRLLYIHPDTMGPSPVPARNPLAYLSQYFTGDYLAVWIVPDDDVARREAEAVNRASGRIRFHWLRRNRLPRPLQRLLQLRFYVSHAVRLARTQGRYDIIVAYGPFTTALAGLVARRLTGTPLIVEFPGHPFRGFELHGGRLNRLKLKLAPAWARFVARRADHLRLLYPGQLSDLGEDFEAKASVFHDFTTVASAAAQDSPGDLGAKYILFLGFPFHLKGVDLLIRAFNSIADRFPEYRLLLVGYCPEPAPYHALAGGNSRIEIRGPVPHDAALQLMAGCSVFVLPSRIEAMGRVLLEAMAFGRPIVASRVGGIPHYVRDGVTGLLFDSEDVNGLAAQLSRLLGDATFAASIGSAARAHVLQHLSEDMYASRFFEMVERTICRSSKVELHHGSGPQR